MRKISNQKTQTGYYHQPKLEKYLKLKKIIKTNEGFSAVIYNDQLGFKTIGYGHLIKKNDNFKRNKSYSKKFLLKIFDEDFYICLRHFKKLYPTLLFPGKRQFAVGDQKIGDRLLDSIHFFSWIKSVRKIQNLGN